MSGSEACGRWGGTPLPRLGVGRSTADRALEGVLSGDFVVLVRACSDTHGPEHTRCREAVPCASHGHEGSFVSAPDRRDRFDVNRVLEGGGEVSE